jgi:SnoaL-like protein
MGIDRRTFWAMGAFASTIAPSLAIAAPAPISYSEGEMTTEDRAILADCRDVALRASMLMDANDADRLVALFTEDMEFVKPSTYPEVSIRGRAQFRAIIATRPAGFISRHICTNAVADRTGADSVTVKSYFTHFSGTRPPGSGAALPIADALRSVGEYEDRLVRTTGGWLIARRTGRFMFGGL